MPGQQALWKVGAAAAMGKSQQSRTWGSWFTQLMCEQLCPTKMWSLELEILLLSTHGLDASAPLGTHTQKHTHAIAALAIGNRHMTRAVFNTQLLIQSTKRGGLRSIIKRQPHRSSGPASTHGAKAGLLTNPHLSPRMCLADACSNCANPQTCKCQHHERNTPSLS